MDGIEHFLFCNNPFPLQNLNESGNLPHVGNSNLLDGDHLLRVKCLFCRIAELEAEKILSWSKPVLREIENAKPLLEQDIPFDPEIEEAAYKKFMNLWPGFQDTNPSAP